MNGRCIVGPLYLLHSKGSTLKRRTRRHHVVWRAHVVSPTPIHTREREYAGGEVPTTQNKETYVRYGWNAVDMVGCACTTDEGKVAHNRWVAK